MNKETIQKVVNDSDELSVNDLITKIKSGIGYLKGKWLTILIVTLLSGSLGFAYAVIKKNKYTATSTFVLDEGTKGGALGQYSGLASLAGIDLPSGSSGGLFQGDNIIELYKSRKMIEQALLSKITVNGKDQLLIDRYIAVNDLLKKWRDDDNINSISFHSDPNSFGRHQDSIISDLVTTFNKKILNVYRPDKKLAIIRVDVTSNDELFSKEFNNKLVETVNEFYTQTKTKKSYQSVKVLQKQSDSVRNVLNSSISGVASAIDAAPNANPTLLTLRVPSQKKQVDVQANTAIYSEMVKNLEISKMALRQETPLIQVIDRPTLPLEVEKLTKLKGIVAGLFLGFFIAIAVLSVRKIYQKLIANI